MTNCVTSTTHLNLLKEKGEKAMSYDGGLSIKVVNSELLKILKDHLKKGTFDGSDAIPEWIGTKHKRMTTAIDYEYWDCAYIDVCPRNLQGVLDAVIALLD